MMTPIHLVIMVFVFLYHGCFASNVSELVKPGPIDFSSEEETKVNDTTIAPAKSTAIPADTTTISSTTHLSPPINSGGKTVTDEINGTSNFNTVNQEHHLDNIKAENHSKQNAGEYIRKRQITVEHRNTNTSNPALEESLSVNTEEPKLTKNSSTVSKVDIHFNSSTNQPNQSSSKSIGLTGKPPLSGSTQGQQAKGANFETANGVNVESHKEEFKDLPKTQSQTIVSNNISNIEIQGAESKMSPHTENISVKPVLPTSEFNKLTIETSTAPTTRLNTHSNEIISPPHSTKQTLNDTFNQLNQPVNNKWKKTLDVIGRVFGALVVVGGAVYLVFSVM